MNEHIPLDPLLEIAGFAAELLERKGFVSVARKRDGVVTLEWWKAIGGKQVRMQRRVSEIGMTPEALAEACASAFSTLASGGQIN